MLDNFSTQEQGAIIAGLYAIHGNLHQSYTDDDVARAVENVLQETGALELSVEDLDALKERINSNTMLCPYCRAEMEGPEQYYDDPTGHTKRWTCPECGAVELRTRHPGDSDQF